MLKYQMSRAIFLCKILYTNYDTPFLCWLVLYYTVEINKEVTFVNMSADTIHLFEKKFNFEKKTTY